MKITNPKVAIVGCTGVVGTEMLNVLKERNFPYAEIRLLASANSAGELYEFDDQELIVEELNDNSFEQRYHMNYSSFEKLFQFLY